MAILAFSASVDAALAPEVPRPAKLRAGLSRRSRSSPDRTNSLCLGAWRAPVAAPRADRLSDAPEPLIHRAYRPLRAATLNTRRVGGGPRRPRGDPGRSRRGPRRRQLGARCALGRHGPARPDRARGRRGGPLAGALADPGVRGREGPGPAPLAGHPGDRPRRHPHDRRHPQPPEPAQPLPGHRGRPGRLELGRRAAAGRVRRGPGPASRRTLRDSGHGCTSCSPAPRSSSPACTFSGWATSSPTP